MSASLAELEARVAGLETSLLHVVERLTTHFEAELKVGDAISERLDSLADRSKNGSGAAS